MMCGCVYEEEFAWYREGETGSQISKLIDRMSSNGESDYAYCIGRMKELGMSILEIDKLITEEGLI